jgi:phosphoribosylformylglycinamidine (FGAM) synthase PurS component
MENFKTIRVEVQKRPNGHCSPENRLLLMAHQTGYTSITECLSSQLYFIKGHFSPDNIHQLSSELLADPVTEQFTILTESQTSYSSDHAIEVTLLPGVTDPVAENLLRAAHSLGLCGIEQVATGQRYALWGNMALPELHTLAKSVFSNPVIQRYTVNQPIMSPFVPAQPKNSQFEIVALREAEDDELIALSRDRCLSLSRDEMRRDSGLLSPGRARADRY